MTEVPMSMVLVIEHAGSLLTKAKDFAVTSDAEMNEAVYMLGQLATAKKSIEAKRVSLTAPLNTSLSAINAMFKEVSGPLEQADRELRTKVNIYQTREKQRIETERRAAIEAAKTQDVALPVLENGAVVNVATGERVDSVPTTIRSFGTSASFPETWTFEVMDPILVPPEYLMVDEKKVGRVVKAGIREIPGIRIFQKMGITVTAPRKEVEE